MTDAVLETATLRMRRMDAAAIEIAEIVRTGGIRILLQPIVSTTTRSVLGLEALVRGPSNSWLHSPLNLFATARRNGLQLELEYLCIRSALAAWRERRIEARLFINISPETMYTDPLFGARFLDLVREEGVPAERCVIELTEDSLLAEYGSLKTMLKELRDAGISIAIDDLGAGSSGLRAWSEIRPDFVKVDRYFVSGIDTDPTKLEFIRSIIDMSRAVGSRIIAEGVETEGECRELLDLGADGLQGYYFCRPEHDPVVPQARLEALGRRHSGPVTAFAEGLAIPVPPLHPEVKVAEAVERFRREPERDTFAVVQNDRPIGVIRRYDLFALMSKPLYPEIFNKKPITAVMEHAPFTIDSHLRLEQVSRLVTRRTGARVVDEFVIVKEGCYCGIGQTIELLRQITEQQVQAARNSNPLTLLPGNGPIRDCLERLLGQGRRFVVCYIDLDGFKPYNDVYGYTEGDRVILHLAELLRAAFGSPLDFIGHVGGDDFIVITRGAEWQQRLSAMLDSFALSIRDFYAAVDAEAGFIEAANRSGEHRRFPLLTLSVGVLDVGRSEARTADAVAQALTRVKKLAKDHRGNSIVLQSGDEIVDLSSQPVGKPVADTAILPRLPAMQRN